MQDKDLYARLLGLVSPWVVDHVELALQRGEVIVRVKHDDREPLTCPECNTPCPGYDVRSRRWRHLDTCQYKTILDADVPRVNCPTHLVKQVRVPWAEPGSRFTALFEAVAIDWLKVASASAVAKQLGISWDEIDHIQEKAVERGQSRRKRTYPKVIGVDETSFRKRHDYVTVISDQGSSTVLDVQNDRKKESLDAFFKALTPGQLKRIRFVAIDMSQPYMQSIAANFEDGEKKIAFDKFHVAKMLGDAVDKTRRTENRDLIAVGDRSLVGTKYLWLTRNQAPDPDQDPFEFRGFVSGMLRTARAWAMKETAMHLWSFESLHAAKRAWKRWLTWASRSRIPDMVKASRTVRTHLRGILTAVVNKITNALGESINAKIQRIKARACGYRNKERFRNAILFHFGGLDLYPAGIK